MPKVLGKFQLGQKILMGWVAVSDFCQISRHISETVQHRDLLWKAIRNSYVLYRMALFTMILSDHCLSHTTLFLYTL